MVGREVSRSPVLAVGVVALAGRGGSAAGAGGAEVVAVEPAHAGPLAHAQGVAAQAVVAHRYAVLHFLPGPDVVGGGGDVVGAHLGHGGALDALACFVVAKVSVSKLLLLTSSKGNRLLNLTHRVFVTNTC